MQRGTGRRNDAFRRRAIGVEPTVVLVDQDRRCARDPRVRDLARGRRSDAQHDVGAMCIRERR
jgi:hypothetical protein